MKLGRTMKSHEGHILAKLQLRHVQGVLLTNFRIFELSKKTRFCQKNYKGTEWERASLVSRTTPTYALTNSKSFARSHAVPLIEKSTYVKITPFAMGDVIALLNHDVFPTTEKGMKRAFDWWYRQLCSSTWSRVIGRRVPPKTAWLWPARQPSSGRRLSHRRIWGFSCEYLENGWF